MRRFPPFGYFLILFAFLTCLPVSFADVDNLIFNEGFEDPLGGTVGFRNWNSEPNRGVLRIEGDAPEGTHFLRLSEPATTLAGPPPFIGVFTFQTVAPAEPTNIVAFSGLVRVNSLDPGKAAQLRIEFQPAGGGPLISAIETSVTSVSSGFNRVTVSGIAPAGTGQVTFVLRIQPSSAGDAGGTSVVDFDDMIGTITDDPLVLSAEASKRVVHRGDLTMIAVQIQNLSIGELKDVELVATPPRGINIHRKEAAITSRNGKKISQRQEGESVVYFIDELKGGEESLFTFPVVVTSGVTPGKTYEIILLARARDEERNLSDEVGVILSVENDPLFDHGTIIGKVFNDTNQNGVQDRGEKGVPWVRLMTEEGIVVITDEYGRYHIPAVKPGRHIVKIDGHTLPEGTKFITEESFLVKTTPGIMNKANFAVLLPPSSIPEQFQKNLSVLVTQGLDTARPNLEVTMEPELLRVGVGVLEKEPFFRFRTNYGDFVKKWFLEIRDEMGREVWSGFGVSTPPAEVPWSGQTDAGLLIKPGLYSYQFKVEDKRGRQDWTPLHFFRVVSKADPLTRQDRRVEIPSIGDFNIFKDGKRSIPLVAKPTIHVQGWTRPENQVTVNSLLVPVDSETGQFQMEFYTSPGDKEMIVSATTPEGETTTYRQTVKVKDSVFFMAALGEEQLGVNFQDGNIETAGQEELFRNGFYENGRLSYYLKGKLKGKFLVKSHYDTDDERSLLFTNLDPEDYYPVYGDASTRDYEAIDTRERFYFVVEMDRSFAKWGSFKTEFNDTELGSYSRTLSGLKVDFETLGSTVYGDPKQGLKVFWAKASHRADHNEFAATGGSLYYLRNRRVIEGSEKIRVETRDKIQSMTISSYDLVEGKDYEMDYDEGRILLSRPLSSVAATDTLITADILDGNSVFLVVDYEFDAGFHAFETENKGIRGYTHLGDHLRVGGTAVEEKRQNSDYDLRAVDAQFKFGRNTKITAEYATSIQEQMTQAISYNGGLSFDEPGLIEGQHTRPRENAYLVKGETKPHKNVEVAGYLQDVEPSFSNDHLKSQEATKKYGLAARYKITDFFYFRYRYDWKEVVDQLRPFDENNFSGPFNSVQTHTAQGVYDDGQWLLEAEYRHEKDDLPETNLSPTLISEIPFDDGLAFKLGYHFNERMLPYVKFQTTIHGKANNQFGPGIRYQVTKNFAAYLEQMIGNVGDSTYFGFEKIEENGARTYTNLRLIDRGIGSKTLASAIGSSFSLTEKSRVYSEREYSSYETQDGYADILGYKGELGNHWDFDARFERRHFDNATTRRLDSQAEQNLLRTNSFNTVSGAVAYADGKKLRARTALEFRRDQDTPRVSQWVTRNSLEYKITQDLSFLSNLNYGKSFFTNPDDVPADFMEFSSGFAFRPVERDRLNVLGRYTYVRDLANDVQFQNSLFAGLENDETSHVLAMDLAYDLHKYLGMADKIAYKNAILKSSLTSEVTVHNILLAHRFNVHVTRKWDVALEYRVFFQSDAAKTIRHGALAEIDREFFDYARLGLGYNFTDFDDDLRKVNNFNSHGPFVRLTGKF